MSLNIAKRKVRSDKNPTTEKKKTIREIRALLSALLKNETVLLVFSQDALEDIKNTIQPAPKKVEKIRVTQIKSLFETLE